ncbi:hypothetical protein H696_06221 [Fonticula alba]|uniref:Uncharacterized protein n=1 Tax=Fonticula alba TaxID=691883 RepID=A0A058Z089_FONAL|nr:hypothetical protein H696_06221 [Fonticula alba]KCV67353.1 hypothetical protein H696_06221 [Fonticula alba]|eukprot:XP_009498242.1 hypothetical protein H696_06221 [Fonticula alba]
MLSLALSFSKLLGQPEDIHTLVLGLEGAGKTTILECFRQLILKQPRRLIMPTSGLNVASLDIPSGSLFSPGTKVNLLDMSGRMEWRKLWAKYFQRAQALIFVIDSTDVPRLAPAVETLLGLLKHQDLHQKPVLILFNKSDHPDALPLHNLIPLLEEAGLFEDDEGLADAGIDGLSGSDTEDAPPPAMVDLTSTADLASTATPSSLESLSPSGVPASVEAPPLAPTPIDFLENRPLRVQASSGLSGEGLLLALEWLITASRRAARAQTVRAAG